MERNTSEIERKNDLDKPGAPRLCTEKPELLKIMHYCSYGIGPELPEGERIAE